MINFLIYYSIKYNIFNKNYINLIIYNVLYYIRTLK